jgi:hypothetical protein
VGEISGVFVSLNHAAENRSSDAEAAMTTVSGAEGHQQDRKVVDWCAAIATIEKIECDNVWPFD